MSGRGAPCVDQEPLDPDGAGCFLPCPWWMIPKEHPSPEDCGLRKMSWSSFPIGGGRICCDACIRQGANRRGRTFTDSCDDAGRWWCHSHGAVKGRTICSDIAICDNHCGWLGSVTVNWGRHIRFHGSGDVRHDASMQSSIRSFLIILERARWKTFET